MSKKEESTGDALKRIRRRIIASAPDHLTRIVARRLVIPRHGPMYVRCPTCNVQVSIEARRGVEFAILALAMRLKTHLTEHENGDGHE